MKLSAKWMGLALAGLMSLSLAACGSPAGGSAGSETTAAASGSGAPAASDAASGQLTGINDLKSLKLAAQRGTVGQQLAEDLVGEAHTDLVTTYEKYVDAVTALTQGKVKAVIMDERPAKRFLAEIKGLSIMSEPLSNERYAIAIKKGNSELKDQINRYLSELKADGTLQAIIEKYNSDTEVSPSDIDLNKGAAGGRLVMGTEAGFAPYELKIDDGYVGIDIELMAAIAKKMDRELVVENMNFDALPAAVNAGKIDCVAAGLTVTPEREANMDFTDAYVEDARQVALVMTADYAAAAAETAK